ncbi:MAG: TonB-dependent receptor, partial [Chitinophagaceae bacterium]|nr:TonB-dependent receptor [Chitinophagaceae bacterium]
GNPFFRPQYAWNFELSHQYRQLLTTGLSYSVIRDYFSQIFLTRDDGILVYTEGNVGQMYNLGLSLTIQLPIVKWWSVTGQATGNYKKLNGFVYTDFKSSITQLNININNQFRLLNKVTAELSGFYTTRARNDLQELLYPTGQVSAGIAIPFLQNKANFKLSVRDIFYTQVMEGLTQFRSETEYFRLTRDTRVLNVSLSYNLGKSYKTSRRSGGSAADEMQRAGSGN